MLMSKRSWSNWLYRGVGVLLGIALLALVVGPALAQDTDGESSTANEFVTYLSTLNGLAMEQSVWFAESTSHAFTTEMDALRAQSYAAEVESGARVAVQDANAYVTQLDDLRALEFTPLVAMASE